MVVKLKKLPQKQRHSVFYKFLRVNFAAIFFHTIVVFNFSRANHSRDLFLLGMVDAREFSLNATAGALQLELGNGPVFERFLSFSFQNSGGDRDVVFVSSSVVLIFLGVNSKALGDEVHFDAFNVLDQTRDWGQKLLTDVPVEINLQSAFGGQELIGVESLVR